ncbi:FMN-binding protein [Sulfurimonas crateris]|uniref:FMN-binding protein n=1 Tax=Sulfurimonas crateris TaxID=2574727 RepID=A0A4U2Z8X6_9BACT|nr:FMN-binding protein [Sulfurimonas crateris]TKI70012.1 FMN-binding protein [Sulfurimonas crateris]
MRKLLLYLLIFLTLPLSAKMLISPIDAMKQNYGVKSEIIEESIILSGAEAKKIQEASQVKLGTKIFKVFKAVQDGKTQGYGVLINRKIRSKNGVVLYMISPESILKGIEVIAFNEPMEYVPSGKWMSQFENVDTQTSLMLSKDIPTITGATLSAKSFVDGSRVAFALYNELLKGK